VFLDFVVFDLVSSVLAKRLAVKNICQNDLFSLSGMQDTLTQSVSQASDSFLSGHRRCGSSQ